MRLANWNLERASSLPRRQAQREQVTNVAADVWVFTETHAAFDPDLPCSSASTAGRDRIRGLDTPEDHWGAIWSRWRMEKLPVSDLR